MVGGIDTTQPWRELTARTIAQATGRSLASIQQLMKTDAEAKPGEVYIRSWVHTTATNGKRFLRTTVADYLEYDRQRRQPEQRIVPARKARQQRKPQRNIPRTLEEALRG